MEGLIVGARYRLIDSGGSLWPMATLLAVNDRTVVYCRIGREQAGLMDRADFEQQWERV